MKTLALLTLASTLVTGCSTTLNKNEVKSAYNKALEEIKDEAADADTSFNLGKLSKYYSGEKKLKKVAILSSVYALASTRGFEAQANSARAFESSDRFRNVITGGKQSIPNFIYDAASKQFIESAGYEIMSPSELAEKSATFRALNAQDKNHEWGSNPTYSGIGSAGSRHLDMLTNAGKVTSKIAEEAGLDGVIQVSVTEVNINAKEGRYNSVDAVSFNRESTLNITVCVPREKAKADGAQLGWFGDANLCGSAQVLNKHVVYFPETNNKNTASSPDVVELSDMTTNYQQNYLTALVAGAIKTLKEEGL